MTNIGISIPNRIPEKMKVAVLNKTFEIELKDREVPKVNDDEVLVKVIAVGVCGSDVHYYEHGKIGPYVVEKPIVLGHECAGIVVDSGRMFPDLKKVIVWPLSRESHAGGVSTVRKGDITCARRLCFLPLPRTMVLLPNTLNIVRIFYILSLTSFLLKWLH
jgi:NADPH:quinone reductase-like Zn-dependent oxidoreductase